MRIFQAIRCFFRVLFDASFAMELQQLGGTESSAQAPESSAQEASAPTSPQRSEAISLLATLQREARFVDLVNESLDEYSDAQIGAAAREALADCGKVLQRIFAFQPVADVAEGESMQVPADYDTGRLRLTGNLSQQPPLTGKLVHAGWVATQCDLAAWTGSREAALVVTPAEIEVG